MLASCLSVFVCVYKMWIAVDVGRNVSAAEQAAS